MIEEWSRMNVPYLKTILILANSIKKYPDRCVAGLEMTKDEGGYRFGPWVRPIDQSRLGRTVAINFPLSEQASLLPSTED